MWEDFIDVAAGPWEVSIRFDRASTAAVARAALSAVLIPDDPARPFALGVRTRLGAGTTLYYGTTPMARTSGDDEMVDSLSWLLAGVADAHRVDAPTTSLRVLVGEAGAVLVAASRPYVLGAREWRRAGLIELPLLGVRVAGSGTALLLPNPTVSGVTRRWAGAEVPVVGLVARCVAGERRDTTIERIRPEFVGAAAQALLNELRDAGRVRTGVDRSRLVRQALTLTA